MSFRLARAGSQTWIVGQDGTDPHQYGIGLSAQKVNDLPRGWAGDPPRFAPRGRNLAVQRGGDLERDEWAAGDETRAVRFDQAIRLGSANADIHPKAGPAQFRQAPATNFGVRIARGGYDSPDSIRNNKRDTRRRAFIEMATGLQRDIEGSAVGSWASPAQGRNLRMRTAGTLMITVSHDTAVADDHGPDRRIRAGRPYPARGQRESLRHEALIGLSAG